MKGNVINLNTLHLNSVRLNGIGKVQSVSLKGGSTEDPVFPPVEPPIEPEPTPTYTLSASVINGKVSAKRNGSAVNLPYTANEGDVIVLSVTPDEGYEFNGWNDGNTDNPRTITMNADVALSAQCVEVVQPPVGNYIQFEDKAVEAICVANWSSDGIGLTEEDAAAVTSIGTTFKGNTEITSFDELQYFTGVTFLGTGSMSTNGAFYGCTSLQSVKIPSSVTRLALGAFQGCSSLKSVGSLSNVKHIEIAAFKGCALEGEISLDSAEGTIGYSAFEGNKFTKVASLGNATTLDGTTPIGSGAFGHCENMQSIDLSKVQVLSTGALSYCNSLEEAILPMVADIRMYAFYSDSSLKKVDIGSNVTHIGTFAFNKCTSLATFICRATTPPTLDNINAFQNTNNCPIYVPDASLEAYKTATNWKQYASRIKGISEYNG